MVVVPLVVVVVPLVEVVVSLVPSTATSSADHLLSPLRATSSAEDPSALVRVNLTVILHPAPGARVAKTLRFSSPSSQADVAADA